MASSHVVLDQVDIAFDDECAVASAGLLLSAYSSRWYVISRVHRVISS